MSDESKLQEEEMYLVARKKLTCISVCERVTRRDDRVTDFEAARALLKPFFDREPYEVVYCIALDSSNRYLGFMKLGEGTINSAQIHLRKIFSFLLLETSATGLIIGHNHPGGSTQPSGEDLAVTRRLSQRLKDIEIRLLDHLIYVPAGFGKKEYWISLRNLGHIPA